MQVATSRVSARLPGSVFASALLASAISLAVTNETVRHHSLDSHQKASKDTFWARKRLIHDCDSRLSLVNCALSEALFL